MKYYDKDWVREEFEFMDGMYDAVHGYRHYLKSKWNINYNIAYEFGGVGGEYYKNYYYSGIRRKGLFNYLANMNACDAAWCGNVLRKSKELAISKRKK